MNKIIFIFMLFAFTGSAIADDTCVDKLVLHIPYYVEDCSKATYLPLNSAEKVWCNRQIIKWKEDTKECLTDMDKIKIDEDIKKIDSDMKK